MRAIHGHVVVGRAHTRSGLNCGAANWQAHLASVPQASIQRVAAATVDGSCDGCSRRLGGPDDAESAQADLHQEFGTTPRCSQALQLAHLSLFLEPVDVTVQTRQRFTMEFCLDAASAYIRGQLGTCTGVAVRNRHLA